MKVKGNRLGWTALYNRYSVITGVRDYIPFYKGEEKGKERWFGAFEKLTNQQVFKEFDAMASIQWVVHQGTIRL